MYKVSKFNYFTTNNKDELLLFNSNKGLKSLCKISKENKLKFESMLKNKEFINNLDKEILNNLIKKGILVKENVDEDLLRKFYKYKQIYNNNLSLIILPTHQCNFRCVYCYENFEYGNMDLKTQDAIIEYVRKNIRKFSSLSVSWFGGEPTLAIKEIEYISKSLIEICKKAKKPYSSNITTNGYLLTEENVQRLIKCKIFGYQVTIDGIKETHNSQKPHISSKDTFDTVINNLLNMKNNIKSKLLNVIIRTNVSKKIYDVLEEYIDFYYDNFNDDKRFSFFIRPVGDFGGNTVKKFSENLISEDEFKLAKWITFDENKECSKCFNYLNCLGGSCNWKCNIKEKNSLSCPYEKIYIDETLILSDKCNEFEKIF